MTAQRGARILNDATSQLDRSRGAPAPETVAVDGRSVAQLLAFAAGLAGMTVVWRATPLAWPWYALVGSLGTLAVGLVARRLLTRAAAPSAPPPGR